MLCRVSALTRLCVLHADFAYEDCYCHRCLAFTFKRCCYDPFRRIHRNAVFHSWPVCLQALKMVPCGIFEGNGGFTTPEAGIGAQRPHSYRSLVEGCRYGSLAHKGQRVYTGSTPGLPVCRPGGGREKHRGVSEPGFAGDQIPCSGDANTHSHSRQPTQGL